MADSKYDVLVDINAELRGDALSGLDKLNSSMTGTIGQTSKLGMAMGALKGFLGAHVIIAGMRGIANSVSGAVARYDTLKTSNTILTSLGASASEAEESTLKLNSAIDGLPTSLDSVVASRNQFVLMGKSVDEATRTTIALNNAFIASGASTSDASRGLKQYTQMLANGKADLMSWRTLQETMAPALTNVAQAMLGAEANTMDLYNALKEGTISFDQFSEAMVKASEEGGEGFLSFEKRAKMMTNTVGGAWSNVKIAVQRNLQEIMTALGQVQTVMEGFSNIDDVFANFKGSADELQNKLDFMNQNLHTSYGSFEELKNGVKDGEVSLEDFNLVLQQQNPGPFVEALHLLRQVLDTLGQAFVNVVNFIKPFWDALGDEGKQQFLVTLGVILGTLTSIVLGLAIANWILNSSLAPIIAIILAIVAVVYVIILVIQNWGDIVQWFKDLWNSVWSWVKDFFGGIVDGIVSFAQALWDKIMSIFNGIKDFIQNVWNAIKSFVMGIVNGIVDGVVGFFQGLWDNIMTIFNGIKNFIQNVWDGIKSIIESVKGAIDNVIGFFQGLWDSVVNIFNGIKNTIENVWNSVKDKIAELNPFKMEVPIEFATTLNGDSIDSLGMAMATRDFALNDVENLGNVTMPRKNFGDISEKASTTDTIVIDNTMDFSMGNVKFRSFVRNVFDSAQDQGLIKK